MTSPCIPCECEAPIGLRCMFEGFVSSHLGSVRTFLASKYFHPLITFAAPGSASMIVFPPLAGNWVKVSRWQWSDLL